MHNPNRFEREAYEVHNAAGETLRPNLAAWFMLALGLCIEMRRINPNAAEDAERELWELAFNSARWLPLETPI